MTGPSGGRTELPRWGISRAASGGKRCLHRAAAEEKREGSLGKARFPRTSKRWGKVSLHKSTWLHEHMCLHKCVPLPEAMFARARIFAQAHVFAQGRRSHKPRPRASLQPVLTRRGRSRCREPPAPRFFFHSRCDGMTPANLALPLGYGPGAPCPCSTLCHRGPSVRGCSVPSSALPGGNSVCKSPVRKRVKPSLRPRKPRLCMSCCSGLCSPAL